MDVTLCVRREMINDSDIHCSFAKKHRLQQIRVQLSTPDRAKNFLNDGFYFS